MKLIVFSDSHGSNGIIRNILDAHGMTADAALHAGDGADSFMLLRSEYPTVSFHAVSGNCDFHTFAFSQRLDETELLSFEGHRILLTHGHRFGVKSSLTALISHAEHERADIVIFGHTHHPCDRDVETRSGSIHLFNPGAAVSGQFGVIEIRRNGVLYSCADIFD